MDDALIPVLRVAIAFAQSRQGAEVQPDDVLRASLLAISRFGITRLGHITIDLEALGIDWLHLPPGGDMAQPGAVYAAETMALLDRAAAIGRAARSAQIRLVHLLAAFASPKPRGLMAKLAERGIDSAEWRAGLADFEPVAPFLPAPANASASYLSPEKAAELLGVHHQTVRAYIRAGKLPGLRIAGGRAIRVRREDLDQLLAPQANPHAQGIAKRKAPLNSL